MKIKLDENLPDVLAELLETLGHEVHTVHNEGLSGRNDPVIWDAAQAESRFLITQDLDFSNIHQFAPGTHAGILLVRLLAPSRQNLIGASRIFFGLKMLSNGQVAS
jgi:predicted nuclease of predicted toxin-antitoxin system